MKKILDLILIFWITFLLVSIFNSDKELKVDNTLDISFVENSYTVPATVELYINNLTSSGITLNKCDISINHKWTDLVFDESFCEDITVNSLENYTISYWDYFDKFTSTWDYSLNLEVDGKKYFDQIEISNKWSIKKLFVWVFYAPIYNLVIGLIDLFKWSFWWAIVWVTVILRIILLYPQHKMMVSQRKLQAIQPKIKKIQEEYKWNQQMLGMKMMELYKTEKVNPFGSCWFLLIQMPILIVIYHIILGIQDPGNIYYLYNFLQGFSITSIDFSFYWLDLLKTGGIQWLILALTVAIIQFLQVKLSLSTKWKQDKKDWVVLEKKSWEDKYSQFMPDPEMLNKFMLYGMPAMVWVFTFTLFAWVWIYWGISTLFMLFQQLIVNKIIKK